MFSELKVYRCVHCDQNTVVMEKDKLACTQCNLDFPIIDSIPVLTRRAPQFVIALAKELNRARDKLKNQQETFTRLSITEKTQILSERALRMANGTALNIALMDKYCHTIWKHVRQENSKDDLMAWATVQAGYSFGHLLPYFYQDWFGTKQFVQVTQDIQAIIETFCNDRESLAVFGTGACGLLYTLSHGFDKSFGIDLALPSLIMAKHLIEGEQLSLCLEKADWMNIQLFPPQNNGKGIHFITANVMDTPFPDGSLSAVITQYLTDIVPNAEWFIHEICRVLKPGGIWINFSNPLTWPLDQIDLGRRRLSEVSQILQDQGFDELLLKGTRFKLLSVEDVFQGGGTFNQEVHIFAARKPANTIKETCSSIKRRIRKHQEEIWDQVPQLVKSREISVIEKVIYSTNSQEYVTGIQALGTFTPMKQDFISVISKLLTGIDGKRTVRKLKCYMQKQGVVMPDSDFIDLMYCLNVEHYLLEFIDETEAV